MMVHPRWDLSEPKLKLVKRYAGANAALLMSLGHTQHVWSVMIPVFTSASCAHSECMDACAQGQNTASTRPGTVIETKMELIVLSLLLQHHIQCLTRILTLSCRHEQIRLRQAFRHACMHSASSGDAAISNQHRCCLIDCQLSTIMTNGAASSALHTRGFVP